MTGRDPRRPRLHTGDCAFRDHARELAAAGALVYGLSAQPLAEQRAFAQREAMPYPLLNDHKLLLADRLALPTFEAGGMRLYRRLTFIARQGRVERVFYPVGSRRGGARMVAWIGPGGRARTPAGPPAPRSSSRYFLAAGIAEASTSSKTIIGASRSSADRAQLCSG